MFLVLLMSSILIRAYSAPISDVDTTTLDHPTPCACPDLTGRTTWNIVWSCVTTVFLCTWVAVHPNIPPHDATRTAIFVRRLKIMLWAIVAPELIILWAMKQWFGARRIMEMFKGSAYGWTRMQAQFAQMGGFVLFENNGPVRVLPPEELLLLSQDNKIDFPKISAREIEDRSKNDPLSKALVIIQTSWFIIQFIARVAEKMAITEIEVVTLALAMLNGVMYFLWWNKPLDVRCAIPVQLKSVDLTTICENLPEGNATDQGGLEGLRNDGPNDLEDQNTCHAELDNLIDKEHQSAEISYPEPHSTVVDTKNCRTCLNWPSWKTKLSRSLHSLVNFMSLVINIIVRTCVALRVGRTLWSLFSFLLLACATTIPACTVAMSQLFEFGTVDPGHTPFYSVSTPHAIMILMLTSVIGTLTGAIHCIIWSFPFPSHTEEVLWRAATALATAYPFLMFLSLVLDATAPKFMSRVNKTAIFTECVIVFTSFGILSLVGRLSLLVQAIVSLRDIPAAAFETDNWSYMIPHL